MAGEAAERAADILSEAARTGQRITALPEELRPGSVDEAHAIQALVVERSGQEVAGWKIATNPEGLANWGVIYARDCLPSPAEVEAERMPLRGVEGEIAFRFLHDLPARREAYSRSEIEAAIAPFPAIEIVDSRYVDYQGTPVLHRLADRMSNGGLILGEPMPEAQSADLVNVGVRLSCNGETLVDRRGGHLRGDPLLPVLDFIHARQASTTFKAGQIMTAGTYTGLVFGEAGQSYEVRFEGVGEVRLAFR